MVTSQTVTELRLRKKQLKSLIQRTGGLSRIKPGLLNKLGIYSGYRGIWTEKKRTKKMTKDGGGVAISLLHTGEFYPDEISEDGLVYHYPVTEKPGHDKSEIESTKNAQRLSLPIFIITHSEKNDTLRDVKFGWVAGWDDRSKEFYIDFQDKKQPRMVKPLSEDDEAFHLTEKSEDKRSLSKRRIGQAKFQFRVFQRYGPNCAVCDLEVRDVLIAAHIRGIEKHGSNDPRNGIVLCANHHLAMDSGLFAINPKSLKIKVLPKGPSAKKLRITRKDIMHLRDKPHDLALSWLWKKFERNRKKL